MSRPYELKAGDTKPLRLGLRDSLGPINLEGSEALFRMRRVPYSMTEPPPIAAPATIVQAGSGDAITDMGVVEYQWADGETDTPGVYHADVLVQEADGTIWSYPEGEDLELIINQPPA